ncbi:Branched-chain-amino-acid transaminase [Bertholletia excelsa]
MSGGRLLFVNGVVSPHSDTPTVASFLESHPGAYTTTRTYNNGSLLLFWERHLRRLADSARILLNSKPKLLFKSGNSVKFLSQPAKRSIFDSAIGALVNDSMRKILPVALKELKSGEELSITALVNGNFEKLRDVKDVDEEEMISRVFDVYVHVGKYVPIVFGIPENVARLAVVGRGRDVAQAKYSEWVRLRRPLEKLRPPLVSELLLSNDGDRILEGCVTNFFVVCRKDYNDNYDDAWRKDTHNCNEFSFEIQTAPVEDGILPGVIRQLIIDICLRNGLPLREVASSWSEHEIWEEAFVTNSLRLVQPVETIQVPSSWKLLDSKSLKDVTWKEKHFEEAPGRITAMIQKEIMKRVSVEALRIQEHLCRIFLQMTFQCVSVTNVIQRYATLAFCF